MDFKVSIFGGISLISENEEEFQWHFTYVILGVMLHIPLLFCGVIDELWNSYRNLLDNLGLWNERAKLDCIMNKLNKSKPKVSEQVYISCNFCLRSISAYIQVPGRSQNPYARFGSIAANKSKMSSCDSCRKPLPRCALCLQHMGTPSMRPIGTPRLHVNDDSNNTDANNSIDEDTKKSKTLTSFSTWFTWCQSCRHGGHSFHIIEWFKNNVECPVTSCVCKCGSLEPVGKMTPLLDKLSINSK